MRSAPLAAAALAACTAALSAQVYRGSADVVLLHVTVTSSDGRFVGGLDKSDFQVFEDNVPQEISNFTREPQPIALSLVIDTSTSMEKRLSIAQEAAIGFVQRLGPRDVAQVMTFSTHAQNVQDFTASRTELEHAIRLTRAGGSTALYEAVYSALNDLKRTVAKTPEQIRRQAIIVLSDGEDTSSLIDYDQLMESAKRSEVSIYTIGLRSKDDGPPHGFNEADFVLRTLAQDTGGRGYKVDEASQLNGIYQQIADELANQYMIGYTSKNTRRDGKWRNVRVAVLKPATGTRARSGYFAPSGSR